MLPRLDNLHPGLREKLQDFVGTDAALAREYGLSRQRIYQLRNSLNLQRTKPPVKSPMPEEAIALLGCIPDKHIAKQFGLSRSTVTNTRRKRGIPTCPPSWRWGSLLSAHRDWMGQLSDREIGRRLGISHHVVFNYRKQHGIETKIISSKHKRFVPLDKASLHLAFDTEGLTVNELAHRFNRKPSYIRTLLRNRHHPTP
jgi:Mor family transcriptional regulator